MIVRKEFGRGWCVTFSGVTRALFKRDINSPKIDIFLYVKGATKPSTEDLISRIRKGNGRSVLGFNLSPPVFPSAPLSYRIRRHPRLKNIQRTTAFPSSFFRFAANFVRRVPSLLISTPPDEIRLLNVSRRACNEYCYETFKFNVPIERIARTYSIHDTKWQPWSMIFWLPECVILTWKNRI